MRKFKPSVEVNVKYKELEHQTAKAYLFKISDGVSIWIPKSKVKQKLKKSFTISKVYAPEVKLKIYAEEQALKNKKYE